MPSDRRARFRREATTTLGVFLALTAAFVLYMDLHRPWWTDREYSARRELVMERRRESPERPILAVLGSSRVGTGFLPESMPPVADADGREVAVFNFSHLGAGPRLNLVQTHRLFRDDVDPEYLLVELMPAFFHYEKPYFAELSASDVLAVLPHADGNRFVRQPFLLRLQGVHIYRRGFIEDFFPAYATTPRINLEPLGGDLKWERPLPRTPAQVAELQDTIRQQYENKMRKWTLDPQLDAALRDTVARCRTRGTKVGIVVYPEADAYRTYYGPGVEEKLRAYFETLERELGVPVYDLRRMMPDDAFIDPHHMHEDGARRFSKRFATEVLTPFVQGQ